MTHYRYYHNGRLVEKGNLTEDLFSKELKPHPEEGDTLRTHTDRGGAPVWYRRFLGAWARINLSQILARD